MSLLCRRSARVGSLFNTASALAWFSLLIGRTSFAQLPAVDPKSEFLATVQPLLKKFCLDCHSATTKKGSLDLERFVSLDLVRKDLMIWQQLIELVEAEEMPPKDKPQPTSDERKRLVEWTRGFLNDEARARAGDPGRVLLRRLSNAEYDCTIRDLTAIDLRQARELPVDGAAGEGFTNASESLADVSPTLLNKYLNAARDIADHAVLFPDGLRFSATKTRRDWTDESTSRVRAFYAEQVESDGRLRVQRYVEVAVRYRDSLLSGTVTIDAVATREKLNSKYLGILLRSLQDKTRSHPLDAIRERWRTAADKEIPGLVDEIAAWQAAIWKTDRVGSYVRKDATGTFVDNPSRQVAADPAAVESVPLRTTLKPSPGQTDIVLSLVTHELVGPSSGLVVWNRPRFEAAGKPPLLLRDYAETAWRGGSNTAGPDGQKCLVKEPWIWERKPSPHPGRWLSRRATPLCWPSTRETVITAVI